MAGNDQETLLKLRADASEVVSEARKAADATKGVTAAVNELKAAEEAKTAMAEKVTNIVTEQSKSYRELQEAAKEAAAMSELAAEAGGIQNLAKDFEGLGEEGGKALKGIASGAQGAQMPMEALTSILGTASPELAALVRGAHDLERILPAVFGPGGLAIGGVIAGLGLITVAMNSIAKSAEEARQRLEQLQEAEDRLQSMQRSGRVDARTALGTHGASGEDLGARAEERSRWLQQRGIDKNVADQVAAATMAAGQAGADISIDDSLKLAALASQGAVDLTKGRTPGETAAALTDSLNKAGQLPPELQASLNAMVEQSARSRLEFLQSIQSGKSSSAREAYLKEFGWEGEGLKAQSEGLKAELAGTSNRRSWERDQLIRQINELQQIVGGFSGASGPGAGFVGPPAPLPGTGWADVFAPPPEAQPDPEAGRQAAEEARRRERVQSILSGLQTDFYKATMSPEEFLRQQLENMGATPEEISQALSLQSGSMAAKQQPTARPSARRAASQTGRQFNPDAQNQPPVVQQFFSGHVVIGDASQPWKGRQPRSPVR